MNQPAWTDVYGLYVNIAIAIATIAAVITALCISGKQIKTSSTQLKEQIKASDIQINKQIEENRRLATEERQHQSRPIIVPKKEISHNTVTYYNMETRKTNESLYTSEHKINWSWRHEIIIELHNMGSGPALNLHCVLYGPQDTSQSQFVSWDNGPIEEKFSTNIELEHPSDLRLFHNNSIDEKHPLYDRSLDSPSNPWSYRIACLTITYHDLFENKYVSIFHYTLKHRWIHVATEKIPSLKGKPTLDLKELNDQKKQSPNYQIQ